MFSDICHHPTCWCFRWKWKGEETEVIYMFFFNWYFEKGRWKCFLASSHTLTLSQWAVSLQLRQHKNWQPGAKFPGCREETQLTGQREGPGPVQTARDLQHQGAAFTDITYLWRVPCTFLGLYISGNDHFIPGSFSGSFFSDWNWTCVKEQTIFPDQFVLWTVV